MYAAKVVKLHEVHWKGIFRPTWERKLDRQAFRHKLNAYSASGLDNGQPNILHYQQLRIIAAASRT